MTRKSPGGGKLDQIRALRERAAKPQPRKEVVPHLSENLSERRDKATPPAEVVAPGARAPILVLPEIGDVPVAEALRAVLAYRKHRERSKQGMKKRSQKKRGEAVIK